MQMEYVHNYYARYINMYNYIIHTYVHRTNTQAYTRTHVHTHMYIYISYIDMRVRAYVCVFMRYIYIAYEIYI